MQFPVLLFVVSSGNKLLKTRPLSFFSIEPSQHGPCEPDDLIISLSRGFELRPQDEYNYFILGERRK